jgi:hypothetical protein
VAGEDSRRLHAYKLGILLTVTFVVLVGIAELTIKLYFFGFYDSPKWLLTPSDDPTLVYELRPGAEITATYLTPRQRDWKYSASINAQGFRGNPAQDRGTRPRVIVVGDSNAFGLGVDDDETFSVVLEQRLEGRAEVLNWGVPGYNLVQIMELLRTRGRPYEPDVVVYALHFNDLEPVAAPNASVIRYTRWSHVYALYRHVKYLVDEDFEVRLDRDREQRVRAGLDALDSFVELSREWNFLPIVFQASCADHPDEPQIRQLFRHAASLGVAAIEEEPAYCSYGYWIPEDWHPTAKGHALLGLSLAPHVERALPEPQTGARGPRRSRG